MRQYFIFLAFFPFLLWGHGLSTASARVELRPANLIEIQVQFNFMDLLNHQSHNYKLPVIASLPEEKFELLYNEVIKLFQKNLIVKKGGKLVDLNQRFPSKEQVFTLIKRDFIETEFLREQKNIPYTFSDRRFYQQFFFDFKIESREDLERLSISFPKELHTVYVTFTESRNQQVYPQKAWHYRK